MNKTIDECLEEVDRWKKAASDRLDGMTIAERLAEYENARFWLEEKLGRKLPEAPPRLPNFQSPQTG